MKVLSIIIKVIPAVILSCLVLISCRKEWVSANGQQAAEVRLPGEFTHIHTSGGTPVFIHYGTEYKVEIKGSSNLIARFKTTVHGEELALGYEDLNLGKDDLQVFVTLPSLRKVSLSGSANIQIDGVFPSLSSFMADISGSGSIKTTDALQAEETSVNISGSGIAWLQTIRSETARLTISGRGDIHIGETENLYASISGRGSIYYAGNPVVESSISGSGHVVKEN